MISRLKAMFDRTFTDLVVDWDEYHEQIDTHLEVRAGEIAKWIEPGSTVLDAGCGDGLNARLIAELTGAQVEGCDIVDRARDLLPVRVVDFDRDGLLLDKTYDYIVFSEVIEHLRYPHRVLVEASRNARRGVIVSIPNTGYLFFRMQLLMGIFPRQSFTHLHYWTYKDFLAFCRQIGLVVSSTKFNTTGSMRTTLKRLVPNLFAYQLYFFIEPDLKMKTLKQ